MQSFFAKHWCKKLRGMVKFAQLRFEISISGQLKQHPMITYGKQSKPGLSTAVLTQSKSN